MARWNRVHTGWLLNKIYDSCDGNTDTYILGDIINMLNNTEIELDKDWPANSN